MKEELSPYVMRARASVAAVPQIGDAVLAGKGLISAVVPFSGRMGALIRALSASRRRPTSAGKPLWYATELPIRKRSSRIWGCRIVCASRACVVMDKDRGLRVMPA